MLQLARVTTGDGDGTKSVNDIWTQKLADETNVWLTQKKQLEKAIIQANMN